jgi:hypothetical protein
MPSLKHPVRLGKSVNPSLLAKANCNYFLFINRQNKEKVKTYLLETQMSPDSSILKKSTTKKSTKLGLADSRLDSFLFNKEVLPIIMRTGMRLCPNVSPDYYSEQFEESDVVIMSFKRKPKLYDFRKPSFIEEICAFAFCKLKKGIFISLICSKVGTRLGGALLDYIENYAKKNSIRKVSLDSLKDPLGFYLYKKYSFNTGFNEYDLYEKEEEEAKAPDKKIMTQDFIDTIPNPKQGYVHDDTWILIRNSKSLDIKNYPVSSEYTWITRMPGYIQRYQRIQTKNSLVEVEDGWETEDDVFYKETIEFSPDNRRKIPKENTDFNRGEENQSMVLTKQSRIMIPFTVPNFGGFITKFVNVSFNEGDKSVAMSKIVSPLVSKKSTMTRRSTVASRRSTEASRRSTEASRRSTDH